MPAIANRQKNSRFQAELAAYKQLRQEWRVDPERYCRERLNLKPSWQQQQALEAISVDGARVSIRSGHNTGKDAISAGIILWFMECMDFPRVPCTAPTGHQLYDVLWGEIAKWMRKSEELSQARGDHPRFWINNLFKLTQDMLYDISAPREWYAVARTARKEAPEGLQGFHASDIELDDEGEIVSINTESALLFVADEASGVPDVIYEVIEGALASPGSRMLEIGNATRNTGSFAAHHKHQRAEYHTLHWRSDESPLCDPDYRQRLVRKFGEGSNVVRVRADGEFPKADDDTLIPIEYTEAALYAVDTIPMGGKRRLGIDVAWRGDDRTAFVLRQGNIVEHIAVFGKLEPMEVVGNALHYVQEWNADNIYIDVIGVGAGVYSRLAEHRESGRLDAEVIEVNVATKAPWRNEEEEAQGKILRDYLWLELRTWFRDDQPAFYADSSLCEDLAGEISSVKLLPPDSNGFLKIEPKDAMKKRLGHSPDLADALCCTFAPGEPAWEIV